MNPSVIVIHETNNKYNYESVKNWFEHSDLEACEAADLFEAIDRMSDFTGVACPDVFLVRVRPGSKQDMMVHEFGTCMTYVDVPIAILSDAKCKGERKAFNFGSVHGLKANLDRPAAAV